MSKALRKVIMHRSKLRKHLQQKRTDVNWVNCKKQRNCCVTLLGDLRKNIFKI